MQPYQGTLLPCCNRKFWANDSSSTVLNNNHVLYNNPTSVVETNSSEKEITNAEKQQKSSSNDSQSETLQIFENLNSMENVSEPELYWYYLRITA